MFNAGPDSSDAVLLDLGILTGQPIGSILMDCMMYSSDDLFEAAFALLDRRFGQRRKLLSALSELEDDFQLGRLNKDEYQQQKIRLQRQYLKLKETPENG